MLAYHIYKLLVVSFSHDVPLTPFTKFLAVLLWEYIVEHLFDYVKRGIRTNIEISLTMIGRGFT